VFLFGKKVRGMEECFIRDISRLSLKNRGEMFSFTIDAVEHSVQNQQERNTGIGFGMNILPSSCLASISNLSVTMLAFQRQWIQRTE
jgi:hypothetical protein